MACIRTRRSSPKKVRHRCRNNRVITIINITSIPPQRHHIIINATVLNLPLDERHHVIINTTSIPLPLDERHHVILNSTSS
jgi:hypothetical protein